jgi:hypothetical protein
MAKKILAKTVHMHLGCPALGGKMSLQAGKENTLEVTPFGIIATSKKTRRTVLLPYSNIIDSELIYEAEEVQSVVPSVAVAKAANS